MVCYCCQMTGDKYDGIGICTICSMEACGYIASGHGEDCLHCQDFYCYQHQAKHCSDNNLDPFKFFPKTARRSMELINMVIQHDDTERRMTALNHGIYLARKLKNPKMEEQFRDALSSTKMGITATSILDYEQKEIFDQLINVYKPDLRLSLGETAEMIAGAEAAGAEAAGAEAAGAEAAGAEAAGAEAAGP